MAPSRRTNRAAPPAEEPVAMRPTGDVERGAPGESPRWQVAVLEDDEASVLALNRAVRAAGGRITARARLAAEAVEIVRRARPDVAVFSVGLADGDGIEAARAVIADLGYPVVLLTRHTDGESVERARAAGVMAYLVKPLRRVELAPALDLAIARFREAHDLRVRLEDRKFIDRAKGRLMAQLGLTEDGAFRWLRRAAMDSRRRLGDVARAVLTAEAVHDAEAILLGRYPSSRVHG